MDFPIILYNIDKQIITKISISKTNCFYFHSYKNISVRILSGIGILYSVKKINEILTTEEAINGELLIDNIGYTLYLPINKTSIEIEVTMNNIVTTYIINLELDNIIDETNEHYTDLLYNNHLPNFDELNKAIPDEFNKSELIKRLLLDFKYILKHKGTKKSIETFLEFIGFNYSNLSIYEEFLNRLSNTLTINPNKETDIKTGNYHVLYDNWESEVLYDDNNLPKRITKIDALDSFKIHLLNAISLANTYFTSDEQDITFFGLNYSSNIPFEQSITSNMNMIFENDVYGFRKNLNIDILNYVDSENYVKVINNCIQNTNTLLKTEVKTYLENLDSKQSENIYSIDYEIFDDIIPEDIDITKIEKLFGNILHININSPNTYVEIEITDKIYKQSISICDKIFITDLLSKNIVIKKTSEYIISIKVTDCYNNIEKYFYDFNINTDIQRIYIEALTSFKINNLDINNNNIDSPSVISKINSIDLTNYVLPIELIPENLTEYFNVDSNNISILKWLTDNEIYILPSLNDNLILNDISEKIPLELIDNWLSILCFKYNDNFELKLRIFDSNINEYIIIDYNEISNYNKIFDCIYIMLLDIYDRDENDQIQDFKTSYYFITTTEVGIDFNKSTYDFILVNKNDNTWQSIYDLFDITIESFDIKIPVNNDFPLFEIKSELFPNFNTHKSLTGYTQTIEIPEQTIEVQTNNGIKYGNLYNWYVINDIRGIAPIGWHIPTDEEWNILRLFVNNNSLSLRSTLMSGTNSTGFNCIGGGVKANDTGLYYDLINRVGYWSSSLNNYPYAFNIYSTNNIIDFNQSWPSSGFNIRYIKDNSINEGNFTDIDDNIYHAVTIGTQVWSQENVATLHYGDGSLIGSDFSGTNGAVTAYNNDESNVHNILTSTETIPASTITFPIVKSIFPRLTKISDENPDFCYGLKLGDIFVCELDNKYVVNEQDINWKIINSFTNELLFQTSDLILKHRIDDNICYDISCDFVIDKIQYNIFKKSLFSSFNKIIY